MLEFCGCCPAYTEPACPDGLNAEPVAEAAFPGVFGAVALPQLWLGCPVICAGLRVVVVVVAVVAAGVGVVCVDAAPDPIGIAPPAPPWPAAIECAESIADKTLTTV